RGRASAGLDRARYRHARRTAGGARHAARRRPAPVRGGAHPRAPGHAARDFIHGPARLDRRGTGSAVPAARRRAGLDSRHGLLPSQSHEVSMTAKRPATRRTTDSEIPKPKPKAKAKTGTKAKSATTATAAIVART